MRSLFTTPILALAILGIGCNVKSGDNIVKSENLTDSAEVLMRSNKWTKAERILLAAIELNEQNAVAYSDLALCKFRRNASFNTVKNYYDRAKNISPNYPTPYLSLGIVYYETKQYQKAIAECIIAVQKYDTTNQEHYERLSEAYFTMGKSEIDLKNYNTGIDHLISAIRFDPNHENVHRYLGYSYMMAGRFNEGVYTLTKAIEHDSTSSTIYINRGICFSGIEKNDLALNDINRALAMHTDDKYAYWVRGLVYEKMNRKDMAIADFRKCDTLGVSNAKEKIRMIQSNQASN